MDLQTLIRELGIDQMPEEKQKPLLETLYRTLQKRVSLRLSATLSDEQVELFSRLADDESEAGAAELERQFPEFEQLYREEVLAMRDDLRVMSQPRSQQ